MIPPMSYFAEKFMAHLGSIGWRPYSVWKAIKDKPKDERLSEHYIYEFCKGVPIKDEKVLEKLSKVEGLGLPLSVLKAWWLLDQAGPEEMQVIFKEAAAQFIDSASDKELDTLEAELEAME